MLAVSGYRLRRCVRIRLMAVLFTLAVLLSGQLSGISQSEHVDINAFFRAISTDPDRAGEALNEISTRWHEGYAAILIELTRYVRPAERQHLIAFLEDQTGQGFGLDLEAWQRWMWQLPYDPHPLYGAFKAALYSRIDPRMEAFFPPLLPTTIRLDEVVWGGVSVNGIPPLNYPVHLEASEARYLADTDIVFGIALNGETMAYPKRILAWHEMALDRVGGVDLTIIYCTLCGTVLPYESEVGGQRRLFGTSGLLYRSNKLFFDVATHSLWSTLEGRPVIGRLAGQDLPLTLHSSVTTTWGEWHRLHPETQVLSLETGYNRDYSEGAAYRDYFATDDLMFQVSLTDDRIGNKDEVLVMLLQGEDSGEVQPWAIATEFLDDNRIYPFNASGRSFLVITSSDGANRVYETGQISFDVSSESTAIVDQVGTAWRLREEGLQAMDGSDRTLPRVTANRAFWFGWYAQFPETQLVH